MTRLRYVKTLEQVKQAAESNPELRLLANGLRAALVAGELSDLEIRRLKREYERAKARAK